MSANFRALFAFAHDRRSRLGDAVTAAIPGILLPLPQSAAAVQPPAEPATTTTVLRHDWDTARSTATGLWLCQRCGTTSKIRAGTICKEITK